MKNTSKNIIEQAILIFNTNGIASSSTRLIARELDVSDGNLRYHFKTKEILVVEILKNMQKELAVLKASFSEIESAPNKLFFKDFFTKSYYIIYKYRCIYLDQVWLYQHMPNYTIKFKDYVNSWRSDFLITFNAMCDAGILSNKYSKSHYNLLFEQLYMYSDSWIFYYQQSPDKTIEDYVNICMSILIPYWNNTNT